MKTLTKKITTALGDVFVRFQKRPAGGKPAVVFLHGWGSDSRVWQPVTQALSYSSLLIDLPGFGNSPVPQQSWSVSDYQKAVEGLVEKTKFKNVVLVGHSFGGQVATAIAAKNPGWLSGLVLVSSASLRDKEPPFLNRLGSALSPLFSLPGLRRLRPAIYKLIGADEPPVDPVMRQTMRNILREDQREKLPDITCPTQLIWGADDQATPLSNGEMMAKEIPDATLTVLSGGHFIFLDQPTAFFDTLNTFINRLS